MSRFATITAALDTVLDPELGQPVTSLGFVRSSTVADGTATVRLRLPTYFCAPNFAFLMVADAYEAVRDVEGVHAVDVQLEDHFAADVINQGVAARAGFVSTFDGEAVAELDGLRATFLRKTVLAGTDRVCRAVLASGIDPGRLVDVTLGDVPASQDLERLRERRRELGLPHGDDTPLAIDPETGAAVDAEAMRDYLARARLTAVGQDANTGICVGMLRHRYPSSNLEEAS
ncbi:MAG: DUF59 domain-containing protein [Streptosporangiales bacterium]|nr:DUF59 domain-containing protein [Streptosporangiales bacterium]